MKNVMIVLFDGGSDQLAKLLVAGHHELVWGADPEHAGEWFVGVVNGEEPDVVYKLRSFNSKDSAGMVYRNLSDWAKEFTAEKKA